MKNFAIGTLAGLLLIAAALSYYNITRQEALYERLETILCRMEEDGKMEHGECVPRLRPH